MDAESRKKKVSNVFDFIDIIGVSVAIVMVIFIFFFRLTTVNGTSMWDTLEDKERLIISNVFYTPKDGDIIVFEQQDGGFKEPLVKRVIATEGQTLYIDFTNWAVFVDGKQIIEPYVTRENKAMDKENYLSLYSGMFDKNGFITIPEGYIFVMGDNRNHSSDSRSQGVGLVRLEDVMGKVLLRVAPLNKFGAVD